MSSFAFSQPSQLRLKTCDERLQKLASTALKWGIIDFGIAVGHRGQKAQDAAFASGNSKLRWPKGKHNAYPSKAFDLYPWIGGIPWGDRRPWDVLAGTILAAAAFHGVKLRWGGDWDGDRDLSDQTFNDLGHFEIIGD